MTCYEPPPDRPSLIRRALALFFGVLVAAAMFGAIGAAMFIISAFLEI